MKKILLFALLPICFNAISQQSILPVKDGSINYSEVVTVDSSLKKSDLFINAKKFFVGVYKSGKDVIQMEDKDAGIIIGKGYFKTYWKANLIFSADMDVWHTIKISIKDGKYKYEITDFTYKYSTPSGNYGETAHEGDLNKWTAHNSNKTLTEISIKEKDEILVLKDYMGKKSLTSDF